MQKYIEYIEGKRMHHFQQSCDGQLVGIGCKKNLHGPRFCADGWATLFGVLISDDLQLISVRCIEGYILSVLASH